MEKINRLYRSTTNKVFGGVAGGIAEYFDVDPIIIRMLFVIVAFAGGGGAFVYIFLWIAIPTRPWVPPVFNMKEGDSTSPPPPPGSYNQETDPSQVFNAESVPPYINKPIDSNKGALIGGLVLVTLGCIFLADKIIPDIHFRGLWPIILVVVGGLLIFNNLNESKKKK